MFSLAFVGVGLTNQEESLGECSCKVLKRLFDIDIFLIHFKANLENTDNRILYDVHVLEF